MIDDNPAERVTVLKRQKDFERRPFTLPELRRLVEVANDEWRGMILFGLYSGQRLADIAALTWHNLGRLNPDGTLDTTFFPSAGSAILALVLQSLSAAASTP